MKIVINTCHGGFQISKRFFDYYNIPYRKLSYDADFVRCEDSDFDERKDSRLIEFIERFGSKEASGECANLTVVEIPKRTLYKINNHDGYESVEYKDITGWEIAD